MKVSHGGPMGVVVRPARIEIPGRAGRGTGELIANEFIFDAPG